MIEVQSDLSEYLPEGVKFSIVNIVKERGGHKLGIKFSDTIEINDELKQALVEHAYLSSRY
ncbi:hypothetical protein QW180_29310 [Vibrio sinaloensis]|nr:hypothetical protein [Vibrio sinaloensis]